MRLKTLLAIALFAITIPSGALAQRDNPLLGSWALDLPGGYAGWLGVSERNGRIAADIMWGFGSVGPIDNVKVIGDKLVLERIQSFTETGADGKRVRRTATETITAIRTGDSLALTTITRRDDGAGSPKEVPFTGRRLPPMPPAPDLSKIRFGRPIQLLNGKDISGWRLTDPNAANGWKLVDGVLVNDPVQTPGQPHKNYGNLRTDREFEDFRLTLEVNVPKGGNSGVYLRGVYEVQVEDSYGQPTDAHHMGAVYSRIKPTTAAEKPAGEWQTLDITLVNRHVTVILNNTKIIDNQPVEGPTGGALWSDPTRPGPIYLQGDHAAVAYRNMVIRPVVRGSPHQDKPKTLGIVLYPQFELLDVYGPVEMFGNVGPKLKVVMVAEKAGSVASAQGPKVVADYGFDNCPPVDMYLVPGGIGTLKELNNTAFLDWLKQRAAKADIVMSVCSGSALLAKAGLLDGRKATSNKQYFQIAANQGPKVKWIKKARWVDDGDRVTSSGVSAGIDMALHVIARLYGEETAKSVATGTEYVWSRDPDNDPFAK